MNSSKTFRENLRIISVLRPRGAPDCEGADGPCPGNLEESERSEQPHEQGTEHVRQQKEEIRQMGA